MLKTHKFARKPFYVDAVRVSENNIEEVAQWCSGEIVTEHEDGKHISVEVHRPMNERQTQAFIGDWVLFAGSGYKVYTPKAFDKSFEKVKTLTKAQADEAGIKVPHEPSRKPQRKHPVPTPPANPVLPKEIAEKIQNDEAVVTSTGKAIVEGEVVAEVPEKPVTAADVEADKLISEVLRKS